VIASVKGEVLVRRPDHVVLEAAGVGYRLDVSAETLKAVPARGKQTTLHAHLVGRDDGLSLYGFASEEERDLFLMLNAVGGIGPKVALATLSAGPVRELRAAIAKGDAKRFQAVPGIGKRTAERIIVELRDRVASELGAELAEGPAVAAGGDPRSEAREGLVNLGYSLAEAEELLRDAEGEAAEEMIAGALRRAAGAQTGNAGG